MGENMGQDRKVVRDFSALDNWCRGKQASRLVTTILMLAVRSRTLRELATANRVSVKTTRRDIQAIEIFCGVPLYCQRDGDDSTNNWYIDKDWAKHFLDPIRKYL